MLQIAAIENELRNGYSSAVLCLILLPAFMEGTFKRVGIVEVPVLPRFASKEWEMRTVFIV